MRLNHETAARYTIQCDRAGIGHDDAETLRRAALTLHSIAEQECNGTLDRAEAGDIRTDRNGIVRPLIEGAVYHVTGQNDPTSNGRLLYYRTADRETGARKRIEAIAARIGATVEYQGDPRGWPVELRMADGRTVSPPPYRR